VGVAPMYQVLNIRVVVVIKEYQLRLLFLKSYITKYKVGLIKVDQDSPVVSCMAKKKQHAQSQLHDYLQVPML